MDRAKAETMKWLDTPGVPLSHRVEDKMRLSKDKKSLVVNPSLTLAGIPPDTVPPFVAVSHCVAWVKCQFGITRTRAHIVMKRVPLGF